jgi:hypothetical protein
MARIRVAEPLLEVRCGREYQFQVGQFEISAALDEAVRLTDVGREHAASADEVVQQFQRFLRREQCVVRHVETQRNH